MEVQSDSPDAPYIPISPLQLAVARDGSLALLQEPTRVAVVELPGCKVRAELPIDTPAEATDVAWVGAQSQLLVLARQSGHTEATLWEPPKGTFFEAPSGAGRPKKLAETRLSGSMRFLAVVGDYALLVGSLGVVVLSTASSHLMPYQFPARHAPVAAGAAGSQFVVALSSSIEEWDPQSRMPKRRFKLPQPVAVTAVGGSERAVWAVSRQDPTRIHVFPMVNRGQPKYHELSEPIAHVAAHPRADLLVCIGANSRRIYVVDIDGKSEVRTIEPGSVGEAGGNGGVEAAGLAFGRFFGVVIASANRPLKTFGLDDRHPAPASPPPTSVLIRRESESERPRSTLYEDDELSVWNVPPPDGPIALDGEASAKPTSSWRDELVAWSRDFHAGSQQRACPEQPDIREMLARYGLPAELAPAISLLYAAHLCGQQGAAPADVASVLGGNWDEALGNGQLNATGIARFERSRVLLDAWVLRALDGLAPMTGTLVGEKRPVRLMGPCVTIGDGDDLGAVAQASLATAGAAILASREGMSWADVVAEARAYGAVAMVRGAADPRILASRLPVIIVVPNQSAADGLRLPQL